ncbi:MAG TPA: MFS transporter [bacterium]|nr:MFS transporter [bacterium]
MTESKVRRERNRSRTLRLFLIAVFALSAAFAMMDATFNNFVNERFTLSGGERSFLELPRELPGVLAIFVAALLGFLCSRRLAAAAMVFAGAGALLIGLAAPTYGVTVCWLFVYSIGFHLFAPLLSTIGMGLAVEGKDGQRLGQLNSVRNAAAIAGSFLIWLGFSHLGFSFPLSFLLIAGCFILAAWLLRQLPPDPAPAPDNYFRPRREYAVFYLLAILFGARKQIFITFAPWVLVTVFSQPTQMMGTLLTIGGIIGIVFQPVLGRAVDRFGERVVLAGEALLLIGVCTGYGFARFALTEQAALYLTCAMFLADQMLMSVGMARSTYIKKIAVTPGDIQSAQTLSTSIDHVFSIAVALLGGLIWNRYGYQYVFLLGALIAAVNFLVALQVRVPVRVSTAGARP